MWSLLLACASPLPIPSEAGVPCGQPRRLFPSDLEPVSVFTTIEAEFSSTPSVRIEVTDANGPVRGELVTFDGTARFTPSEPLTGDATYSATVTTRCDSVSWS